MEWIDVQKELPPEGEMVLVCCLIADPTNVLRIGRKPWIFQAVLHRYRGWKVFYLHDEYVFVYAWKKLEEYPETDFLKKVLEENAMD